MPECPNYALKQIPATLDSLHPLQEHIYALWSVQFPPEAYETFLSDKTFMETVGIYSYERCKYVRHQESIEKVMMAFREGQVHAMQTSIPVDNSEVLLPLLDVTTSVGRIYTCAQPLAEIVTTFPWETAHLYRVSPYRIYCFKIPQEVTIPLYKYQSQVMNEFQAKRFTNQIDPAILLNIAAKEAVDRLVRDARALEE